MYDCNSFFSATIWTSRSFKPVEPRDVPTSSQRLFFPDYLSPSTSSSQTIAVSCRFVGATKVGEKEATGGSVCQEDLGCAKVADDW